MQSPHRTTPDPRAADLVESLRRSDVYRDFQQAFVETTHLPLGLRAADTSIIGPREAAWVNPLCLLLASVDKACAACMAWRERVALETQPQARTARCRAGLCQTAVPVRLGDSVIAFLETGQVLLHRPSASEFKRTIELLSKSGVAVEVKPLERAYFHTRVLERKHYAAMVRLITIFAEHLSNVSNQLAVASGQAGSPAIEKAKTYIAQHASEDLSLVGVAHAVNTSPFYFCKIFRQATGLHFVDYLGRVRVEKAKSLLLNPHRRISEAAFDAGFQSLSQFNRVFRRVVGEPPTRWRSRVLRANDRALERHRPGRG